MSGWYSRKSYWSDDHGSELYATIRRNHDGLYDWCVRLEAMDRSVDVDWEHADGEFSTIEEAYRACDAFAATIQEQL